jgi:hypothetical protein
VAFLDELKDAGVDLYLDRQGVDTSTPAGKALFQMLGVFAEFERSIIQERIQLETFIRSVNYLTPLNRFLNDAAERGRMGRPSGKCRLTVKV